MLPALQWRGIHKHGRHKNSLPRMRREFVSDSIRTMRLFRAVLPHFVCGLLVGDMGIVMEAAPIAKWAEGRPLKYFRDWAEHRCGSVEEVICER
jgi:hypothetical protein